VIADYGVALFRSTSAALRAEKVLNNHDLPVKMIPVPRELSSECGIALRFPWTLAQAVEDTLESAGADYAAVRHLPPLS
jgi:hypothetical protein